jgi:hypothetical protein
MRKAATGCTINFLASAENLVGVHRRDNKLLVVNQTNQQAVSY